MKNNLTLSFRVLAHQDGSFTAQLMGKSLMIGSPTGKFPTPGAAVEALGPQVDAYVTRRSARSMGD